MGSVCCAREYQIKILSFSLSLSSTMTSVFVEDCPWFAGSMEREKAEQFLIDVSIISYNTSS